jgi:hypothetical protein
MPAYLATAGPDRSGAGIFHTVSIWPVFGRSAQKDGRRSCQVEEALATGHTFALLVHRGHRLGFLYKMSEHCKGSGIDNRTEEIPFCDWTRNLGKKPLTSGVSETNYQILGV